MSPETEQAIACVCVVAGLGTVGAAAAFTLGWQKTLEQLHQRTAQLEYWRGKTTEVLRILSERGMHERQASSPPPLPLPEQPFRLYRNLPPPPLRGVDYAATLCAPEYHAPRDVWND